MNRRQLSALLIALLLFPSLAWSQGKIGGTGKVGGTVKVAVSAGGGEVDFVTDSFTEASDTELSVHTPELGGPWVDHPHSNYTSQISLLASTDRIYPTGSSAYYATATPPSADYCSEAVIFVASAIAANAGPTVRFDTTDDTGYVFRIVDGTSWSIRRIVTTTQTTLGSVSTDNLPGVGESRTMKLCITGGATPTLTGYIDGVALVGPGGLDGSPITATGKAGVRFTNAASSTTGFHLSSFRAFTP